MPTTPWRIAAQSLVVLDPDTKEPAFTLSFDVNHAQADQVKLRMVSLDGSALEFTFAAGGYVQGEPVRIAKKAPPEIEAEKSVVDTDGEKKEPAPAG